MEFIGILCNVYFEKNFLSVEILVKLFIVVLVFEKKKKKDKICFLLYVNIFNKFVYKLFGFMVNQLILEKMIIGYNKKKDKCYLCVIKFQLIDQI